MDIFEAARSGNTKALARMVKGGEKVIDQHDKQGVTALLHAAFAGRADAVRILLNAGASVKFETIKGHDALWLALANNRKAVVAVFEELLPDYTSAKKAEWEADQLTKLKGSDDNGIQPSIGT